MTDFKRVTDDFYVSPQISVEDVKAAKEAGFTMIIVNRPDGEMIGQPSMEAIRAAAQEAGLAFGSAPIAGPPSEADIADMDAALKASPGKTLAYCRSGTRSITLWALVKAQSGMSPDDILSHAADAGYDLTTLKSALDAVAP